MKPHLVLPGLALACKGSPTPVQVPLDTERIELTCTETRARVWRPDALQAGLVHAYAGLAPIVSEDDGRAWRRGGVLPAAEVAAAIGRVGLALEVGEAGQEPYWVATSDLWETLERPSFTGSDDPWLPEGAYEASLADGTRVAVTDTGRVYAHLDGAWRGAPDAYALGAGLFGARIAASDGDRELVVQGSGPGQTLAGTEDRGATWDVPVVHPGEVITDLAMNADGLVVAGWDYGEGEIDSGISVSPDFARTWTHLPLHLQRVSLGPGPQEIWATAVVGVDATGEILELRHTTDAGATWTRVELWAGEALVDPVYDATGLLGTRRVFLDGAGARVLPLATHAGPGVPQESWRCVEGGPGGFVRQEVSRDDSPGTVTLWDRNPEMRSDSLGAVVPGLEPGEGVWPTWTFAGSTALGAIHAMDHDADLTGLVALAQYDGDVFDGFSTLLEVDLDGSIVGSRPWDTYGEDDGGGLDAVPLAGAHMRVDPVTGVARVITDVGIVRITDSLQAQIPELAARIGNTGRVRPRLDLFGLDGTLQRGGPDLFLWDDTPQCGADTQTVGCRWIGVPWRDFAVRDGALYVLDDRFGDLWRYSPDPAVPPELVATGFLEGSVLYTSLHADLPGVFVLDHHLYRVLPGATTAVRP